MEVIQAPRHDTEFGTYKKYFSVFLAGGITGCRDWQDEVIETLCDFPDLDNLKIFNPRRDNFDNTDLNAAYKQIKWENKYLLNCNLVTYFFDASESVQPITLFELGKYGNSKDIPPIITVVDGYKRKEDVLIQTALSGQHAYVSYFYDTAVKEHARAISDAYLKWRYSRYEI